MLLLYHQNQNFSYLCSLLEYANEKVARQYEYQHNWGRRTVALLRGVVSGEYTIAFAQRDRHVLLQADLRVGSV